MKSVTHLEKYSMKWEGKVQNLKNFAKKGEVKLWPTELKFSIKQEGKKRIMIAVRRKVGFENLGNTVKVKFGENRSKKSRTFDQKN